MHLKCFASYNHSQMHTQIMSLHNLGKKWEYISRGFLDGVIVGRKKNIKKRFGSLHLKVINIYFTFKTSNLILQYYKDKQKMRFQSIQDSLNQT